MQEYRPYQYDISWLLECAYVNRHYFNITFCQQDYYYSVTWLVFCVCAGISALPVWHQSAARVRLCQQALLQHNLLPTGWLTSIQWLVFFVYVQEYRTYQYDISWLPECAYANRHYYKITFCQQDDYYPVTCLFRICAGVSSLPVRHQSAARVCLCQQALLQHNLLPAGRLLSSDLTCLLTV